MATDGARLVRMCIKSASADADSVERWRRQRRTLERLPAHLADGLLRSLRHRRLLFPSLLEVFQHCVEEVELNGESNVDAEWMVYLGAFRHLRCLNLADCRGINNSALWAVTGMSCLKELDLSRCSRITDDGINHLLSIPNLEKLFISETGLTTDGVMLICSFKNLTMLDMGGLPVTDKALFSLQILTQLEYLDLWGSKISDDGATILKMFPRLSFLNLAWTNVTKVPCIPSIASLNMSNCVIHSISFRDASKHAPLSKLLVHGATFADVDEVFSKLEGSFINFLDISQSSIRSFCFLDNMKGLQHLDLSACAITDDLVGHVAHIGGNLRFLNLNNTKITSLGLPVLTGSVNNLQTLMLSHTSIDDTALSYISMLPSLLMLDLSHTNVKGFTDRNREGLDKTHSLGLLQNLSHLESLNLEDTLLRDEAIQPLSLLQELKYLYLKSDFLSDISLHAVSSLPKLEFLGFRGAVLTDYGLLFYTPRSMLSTLDVRGCWLLTNDALSSFCKMHPRLEVRHEQIQMLNANESHSHRATTASASPLKFRQKREKMLHSPSRYPKVIFADERIKYGREELFELQLSPLADPSLCHPDKLPQVLRRD